MALKIKQDQGRFGEIVRGRIKQELHKYISQGEMIGRQGPDRVSIPLPQIDLPHFAFDPRARGGVGQGDGAVGQILQPGSVQPGSGGPGDAGQSPAGSHDLEVEVSYADLAQMLGEALQLPRIEPRGSANLSSTRSQYTGVQTSGPESLRHFKRTYRQALRRQMIAGDYNAARPVVVPGREDRRYRSWKVRSTPEANAVILYMMDVSGSMGAEQKEIVRIESFWIDTWLRSQYKNISTRFITHDAVAREVDRETFFHTRESGGTMISSAYKLCAEIIAADYPVSDYNIYPFHFSDGDNWSADDTRLCLQLLRGQLLPAANVFCYAQVESPYGSGQFIKDLSEGLPGEPKLLTSEVPNKDAIPRSIQDFLGKPV